MRQQKKSDIMVEKVACTEKFFAIAIEAPPVSLPRWQAITILPSVVFSPWYYYNRLPVPTKYTYTPVASSPPI